MEKGNYTYIVECADGTLYTGWTTDPEQRVRAHNEGKGAKYTRSRRPVKLVYYEAAESEHDARSREVKIKQLSREEKLKMIAAFEGELPAGEPGPTDATDVTGSTDVVRAHKTY